MSTPQSGLAVRTAALGLALALSLAAQPPLTTIQDVLYKADGTRFNGYVEISWTSFEASDTSNIATQFRAVRIVDGNLSVKLVPTTNADPPAIYTVTYNSSGKVQFQETWAVPPSSHRLRIRDVRISIPSNIGTGTGSLQESDIVGLVADLTARPIQGPGYATGRVVYSNSTGQLEAVSGDLSDCVRVDGSSGPCGSAGVVPGYVDAETPGGLVDGANTTYTLAGSPVPASSLALYRNGVRQKAVLDYSVTGSTIQFVTAATPQPGDTLLASYRVAGVGAQGSSAPSVIETLCSSSGGTSLSMAPTVLGTCIVPAGTLKTGDRVEIFFDFSHAGSQSGFGFQVLWGNSTALQRTASAADTLVAGRAAAGIDSTGARLSAQSWGTVLPLAGTLAVAPDSLAAPLSITLSASLAQAQGDSVTLNNFTVLRYSR